MKLAPVGDEAVVVKALALDGSVAKAMKAAGVDEDTYLRIAGSKGFLNEVFEVSRSMYLAPLVGQMVKNAALDAAAKDASVAARELGLKLAGILKTGDLHQHVHLEGSLNEVEMEQRLQRVAQKMADLRKAKKKARGTA